MSFTLTIGATTTISGTKVFIPQETGNYYLRKDPFSSATYSGTHIGDGCWDFGNVEDGSYQLWNASSYQSKFGTFQIVDNNPVFSSMAILGNMSVTGQVNFFDSFNLNNNDVAHIDNLQVHSLSENSSGSGITFSHKIVMSDVVRVNSNLPGLNSNNTFGIALNRYIINPEYIGNTSPSTSGLIPKYWADATYGRLGTTNSWVGQNIFTTLAPQSLITPTIGTHLTNKTYVDTTVSNAVLTANFGSITAAFVNTPSVNVVRLLPNAGYSLIQRCAPTWAMAMKLAKDSITGSGSSATIQQIISIEGIGISDTNITVTDTEIGTYFYPKVHIKGLSQSVRLFFPDDSFDSGGSATSSLVENVTIYHDDSGLGATPNFSNMTFKDCYFDMKVDSLTLTNCMFKGTNIFKMQTGNLYLNSISGTGYYTTVVANKTGNTPMEILETYL